MLDRRLLEAIRECKVLYLGIGFSTSNVLETSGVGGNDRRSGYNVTPKPDSKRLKNLDISFRFSFLLFNNIYERKNERINHVPTEESHLF